MDAGESLLHLMDRARHAGFLAIELRQGSLGEFESYLDGISFAPDSFSRLADRFPDLQLNLAVSLPLFGPEQADMDDAFQRALDAAVALGGGTKPHLRLVDTTTRAPRLDDAAMERAARRLALMTRLVIDRGGDLAVEHAYQNWSSFNSVFQQSRRLLASDEHRLRCCFDPCNLLLTESVDAIIEIVRRIRADEVSMIHIKQRQHGTIKCEVGAGDLDWIQLLATLDKNQHAGPWLFEIAPSDQIWDCLERSIQYFENRDHPTS
ncbi:MAG: TIM barrel protein [Planctomycetota bacterium]